MTHPNLPSYTTNLHETCTDALIYANVVVNKSKESEKTIKLQGSAEDKKSPVSSEKSRKSKKEKN